MEAVRQLLAVGFVFALLGLAVWALRRQGPVLPMRGFSGRKNRHLESSERLALTAQHALHLVRFGERELLVATHPQGCSVIAGEDLKKVVGRTPWSAAGALAGLVDTRVKKPAGGPAADQGVRPTTGTFNGAQA